MAEASGSHQTVTADGASGREGRPVHGGKGTSWLGKVFELNPAGINWPRAVMVLDVLLVPLVVFWAIGHQEYLLSAVFGVLFTALTDPGGGYGQRVFRIFVFGAIGAGLTALGFGIGGDAWGWLVLAGGVVTLVTGLAIMFGARRFVAAYLLDIWFIIALVVAFDFHHHTHVTQYTWAQTVAWAGGAVLWIVVTFVVWLVTGRHDQPPPFAEIPGDTSRQKLTPPLITYAVLRALVMAGTLAIAFGATSASHGYWLAIGAIFAMKPTLAQSTIAGVQRVAGALIGGVAAGLLLLIPANLSGLHLFATDIGLSTVALVLLIHGVGIRFYNYALYYSFISAGVLLLIDLPQPTNYGDEGYRLLWTLCGVAIGVLVMFLAGLLARRGPPAEQPKGAPAAKQPRRLGTGGLVLIGLGTCLIVFAVLMSTYVSSRVVKFPLNQYTTATLVDNNASYFSPAKLTELSPVTMEGTYTLNGNGSAGSDSTAVWNEFVYVYDQTNKAQVQIMTRTMAFDRRTAQLVNCCGSNVNGHSSVEQSGVVGYVFPIGTQKQTYLVFDANLLKPMPFTYDGTDTVNSIQAYRFVENVAPIQNGHQTVPGSLVGMSQSSATLPQFYQTQVTYWIDPDTGVLLKATQDEKVFLENPAGQQALLLFNANMVMTPASVKSLVAIDNGQRNKKFVVETLIPLVAGIVGVILLVAGILLARRRRGDVGSALTAPGSGTREAAEAPASETTASSAERPSLIPGLEDQPREPTAETQVAEPQRAQAEPQKTEPQSTEAG